YSHFCYDSRPPPHTPTPFPYTTLFRSRAESPDVAARARPSGTALSTTRSKTCVPWSVAVSRATGPDWRRTRPSAEERGTTMSMRSEEHTSELQSRSEIVCRLLLEKKKQ